MLSDPIIKYKKGFTLIELLVTIAMIGIITSIAIPNFTGTIRNSRLTTNANVLLASLNYARSEAIKRGRPIKIGKIGGANRVWDGGWNIFIDLDGDDIFNNADTLLKTYPALTNGYTLSTGRNYAVWIEYTADGLIDGSGPTDNDTFTVCATSGNTIDYRRIIVNQIGRARVSSGNAINCR